MFVSEMESGWKFHVCHAVWVLCMVYGSLFWVIKVLGRGSTVVY